MQKEWGYRVDGNNMLSLTKCKNILNKNGIKYEDNEIKKLKELLYALAKIELEELNK